MIGYCKYCRAIRVAVKRRRLNTVFLHDPLNFIASCQPCYEDKYQKDMNTWDEIEADAAASTASLLADMRR